MAVLAILSVGCSFSVGKSPGAPSSRPFCTLAPSGETSCFASEAERDQALAQYNAAVLVQVDNEKRAFLEEKAAKEAAQEERQRLANEERERNRVEADAKRAAETARVDAIRARAVEPAIAVRAISALMCSLEGGPNAQWRESWRAVLRERFKGARPLPCAAVQPVLDCQRAGEICGDDTARAAADALKYAERDLWGDGPRSDAPLRCCDGEESSGCTCGGPRRGCCSHHGGVCGCAR